MPILADALQVTIAAATAATFVGIVGVALFQAWLNRAWLTVRVGRLEAKLDWKSHPPSVLADFQVLVFNRSRRQNSFVSIRLSTTRPSVCEVTMPGTQDGKFTIRADGMGELPVPIHVSEILIISIHLRLWEDDSWIGSKFEGRLSLVDMHDKQYAAQIVYQLPDLKKEDP